jgi:ATP-dependent DNA helicase RecG
MGPNVAEQLKLQLNIPAGRDLRLYSVPEIYSILESINLVDLKEDRRFERKPSTIHTRSLADYFSIFANTAPEGGVILIGVEDDGSVSGCLKAPQEHLNDIERVGDVHCPEASYECRNVKVPNARGEPDYIIAIWVKYSKDKLIELADGSAFTRRGSSRRKLSPDEAREWKDSKGQVQAEQEPVRLKFPEDFEISAITHFLASVRDIRQMSPEHKTEEILEFRHLGKKDRDGNFIPNLACALLFAKDPESVIPGCRIRFFRYSGTVEKTGENYNVIKDFWFNGTVPELIRDASEAISAQVREFQRLGKDERFYSVPEYPRTAWYEALVNACIHRSYVLKNMHVFVKMFDDRLVIESPGGFPPFVTPENIYDMHQPRNPHLMEAMFYLRYVQAAHEGTRRMRDTMQELGLPAPIFTQRESGTPLVQVVLKNDIEHRKAFLDSDAFTALGPQIAQTLSVYERRIVNFIVENRDINVTQASALIDRRWQFTKKVLMGLVERGILDHVHSDKVERDSFAYFTLPKRLSDRIRRQQR